MKAVNLSNIDHPVFEFIRPTDRRLNRSVAWLVKCKSCGREQLVGASQVRYGQHNRCIYCQIPNEITAREV